MKPWVLLWRSAVVFALVSMLVASVGLWIQGEELTSAMAERANQRRGRLIEASCWLSQVVRESELSEHEWEQVFDGPWRQEEEERDVLDDFVDDFPDDFPEDHELGVLWMDEWHSMGVRLSGERPEWVMPDRFSECQEAAAVDAPAGGGDSL